MKPVLLVFLLTLPLQSCAIFEDPKPEPIPHYCDDMQLLQVDYAPQTYVAVETAVRTVVLNNGFSPDEGAGKFVADKNRGDVVGYIAIRLNKGLVVAVDGNLRDMVPAPPSVVFETQTSCKDMTIDYQAKGKLFDKLEHEVIENLNARHIQAIPGVDNKKSVQHLISVMIS